MSDYQDTRTMSSQECISCGITFAMPKSFENRLRETHANFYCPNGHYQHYTEKSETEKLRARVEQEQRAQATLRERAVVAERAQQKAERVITRLKKRSAAGVCPCCNRTFKELAEHMKSKHKEFRALVGLEPKKQLQEGAA
jgi:predicted GIY-YIG superfamily endonuclease